MSRSRSEAERVALRKLDNSLSLQTITADATDEEEDVERLFESVGALHHIVSTAADVGGVYVPLGLRFGHSSAPLKPALKNHCTFLEVIDLLFREAEFFR